MQQKQHTLQIEMLSPSKHNSQKISPISKEKSTYLLTPLVEHGGRRSQLNLATNSLSPVGRLEHANPQSPRSRKASRASNPEESKTPMISISQFQDQRTKLRKSREFQEEESPEHSEWKQKLRILKKKTLT
jgi:hypothetical protein